jgi:hypothetical protein
VTWTWIGENEDVGRWDKRAKAESVPGELGGIEYWELIDWMGEWSYIPRAGRQITFTYKLKTDVRSPP